MGWLTVLAYFGTASLCARSAWTAWRDSSWRGGAWFWTFFTAGLVFLGINKQLDLQTWLTLTLRNAAIATGWYHDRRALQAVFVVLVAVTGMAGIVGLKRLAGRATRPILVALAGGVFLGCFILIRASSFHHVDQMLGMRLTGVKVNWLLELGSLACIAAAAWMEPRGGDASARGANRGPGFCKSAREIVPSSARTSAPPESDGKIVRRS